MEHLNETPARSSNFDEKDSLTPINCDSLNSNYVVSFESLAKNEMISTK